MGRHRLPRAATGCHKLPDRLSQVAGYAGSRAGVSGHRPPQVATGHYRPSQVVTGRHRLPQVATGCPRPSQVATGHHRLLQAAAGCRTPRLQDKDSWATGRHRLSDTQARLQGSSSFRVQWQRPQPVFFSELRTHSGRCGPSLTELDSFEESHIPEPVGGAFKKHRCY